MKDVYSQIIGLLFFLSGVWIDAVLDTAQAATAADYSQQDNGENSFTAYPLMLLVGNLAITK